MAEVKDFKDIENKMKRIQKKTNSIEKMQEHQLISEDHFHNNQMKNSEKIALMSVLQIIIVVVIGSLQILALKRVFRNKN